MNQNNPRDPKAPREWKMLYHPSKLMYEPVPLTEILTNQHIHVIEKSYFDAACVEIEGQRLAIDKITEVSAKEIHKLRADLDLCIGTLETIANGILPNGDHVEGATVEFAEGLLVKLRTK